MSLHSKYQADSQRDKYVITLDLFRFMLDLKKETKDEFATKVSKMASCLNFKVAIMIL